MPITYQKLEQLNRAAQNKNAELQWRLEALRELADVLVLRELAAAEQINQLVAVMLVPNPTPESLATINPNVLRESLERKDETLAELIRTIGAACDV